jgi:hypothetical protein
MLEISYFGHDLRHLKNIVERLLVYLQLIAYFPKSINNAKKSVFFS